MDFDQFKHELDSLLAGMSEAELVASFEAMGCEFEDIEEQPPECWWAIPENWPSHFSSHFDTRTSVVACSMMTAAEAADSNELALAA